MREDPLVEEVRSARQKIFEACHEDLDTLLDRFQEQERRDRERLVSDTAKTRRKKPNGVRP